MAVIEDLLSSFVNIFNSDFFKEPCKMLQMDIQKAILNDPATIVYWSDGTKTVVKCQEGDAYDERTGLLLCCAKRLFGNTGHYNDVLSRAMEEFGGDAK